MNKDPEEGGSLLACIGLKLILDIDDECRSDSREQTSLLPCSAQAHWNFYETHKDQSHI